MIDPAKPLENARHEAFAVHYALNGNAAKAWIKATKGDAKHSDANGSKWVSNGSISKRVDWIKAKAAQKLEEKAQKQTDRAVLTIVEKREFCARVVRAKLTETPDDSDLWQEIKVTQDGISRKMPDKLRAIAMDNDLAGEGSEAKANESLSDALSRIRAMKRR